jgi:hypothetical protein
MHGPSAIWVFPLRWTSIAVPLIGLLVLSPCHRAEGADFSCAGGDVQCLIDAITTSNQNQEANTIRLAAGTYALTTSTMPGSFNGSGLPVIVGDVAITGVTADATIIERANYRTLGNLNPFRIFTVAVSGRLSLDRVTVRGGSTGNVGIAGGILSQGSLTIRNSTIAENYSATIGAIQAASGTVIIRDSLVTANAAGLNGDIVALGATIGVPGATGIVSAEITRTTLSDNEMQEGSAIDVTARATATITDVTIVDNFTGNGGGIVAFGSVTVLNSTIANTSGIGNTFGITGIVGSNVLVTNSTITSNKGGIAGQVRLQNSIVAGNRQLGDCGSGTTSLGHNLIANPLGRCALLPSDLTGDAGVGSFVNVARPGGGYVPLLASSPAIDAADPTACPTVDQRRLARPIDGNADGIRACDIGAAEFYPVVNDLLGLDAVSARYTAPPSSPTSVNPFAPGGEFRVTATFTGASQDICHLAFEVVTLGAASAPPVMLTATGDAIGGEGIVVPAPLVGGEQDLLALAQRQYLFRVGVAAREAITFFVNVLGEPAITPCSP